MKSKDYWRKREQDNIKRLLKNDINYQKEIERIYAENLRNVESRIDSLYRRYSDKNGEISLADVKAIADKTDVTALAETAKKMSQDKDFSQYANDVLAKYNLKMQVSRLELLKDEINLELIKNGVNVDKYVADKLTDETKAELKRQAGILGDSLDVTDTKLIKGIVNGSFGSSTFSERLWGNTQYLANSLDTLLTQSVINGRHPNDIARELRRQFDVSQKQAERLMRTESARVHAESAVKSMEKNGVTKYEWVSEPSACKICSPLNGKTFEVKGAEFGNVNHPLFPLHPNCRCAVIAVIDKAAAEERGDEIKKLEDKNSGTIEEESSGISYEIYDETSVLRSDEVMKWIRDVNQKEKNAVGFYTGAGNHNWVKIDGKKHYISSFQWNEYMMSGKVPGVPEGTELEKLAIELLDDHTKHLDSALNKGKSPLNMITMRGMSKKEFESIGTDKQIESYRSTTIDYDIARQYTSDNKEDDGSKYLAEFRIPKGSKGAYVWQYSMYADESEWLLPRDSRFRRIGDTYIDKDGINRAVFELLM